MLMLSVVNSDAALSDTTTAIRVCVCVCVCLYKTMRDDMHKLVASK